MPVVYYFNQLTKKQNLFVVDYDFEFKLLMGL
jgi:hypothetical protein